MLFSYPFLLAVETDTSAIWLSLSILVKELIIKLWANPLDVLSLKRSKLFPASLFEHNLDDYSVLGGGVKSILAAMEVRCNENMDKEKILELARAIQVNLRPRDLAQVLITNGNKPQIYLRGSLIV